MAYIDDLIAKVQAIPIGSDGSLTMTAAQFADDFISAFFNQVIRAADLSINNAQKTLADGSLSIAGRGAYLGYSDLDTRLIFSSKDGQALVKWHGRFSSDKKVQLPVVTWIGITDIIMTAVFSQPYQITSFKFHATIIPEGGQHGIPVEIAGLGRGEWQIKIAEGGAEAGITGAELVALLAGNALNSFFPQSLSKILDGFVISDISSVFNTVDQSVAYFSAGLRVTNGWDIVPGIALQPGLKLLITLRYPTKKEQRQFIGILKGTFAINRVPVAVFVQNRTGAGENTWMIGLDPEIGSITLPSLGDLFDLTGDGQFKAAMPAGLREIPGLVITRLEIDFSVSPVKLQAIFFAASTASKWPVLGDFFTVENVYFDLQLLNVFDSTQRQIGGMLSATFAFADRIWLNFTVKKEPQSQDWLLIGSLAPEKTLSLTNLVSGLLSSYVTIPQNAPALVFDTVQVSVIPGKTMEFAAASQTKWDLIPEKLTIERFALDFKYESQVPKSYFSGVLATSIAIAGVTISIKAELNNAGGGWSFVGSTVSGQRILIGALLSDLADKFGVGEVPDVINSISLQDLSLSFTAGSGSGAPQSFHFNCTGNFTITERDFVAKVDITLDKQGTNYTGRFTGKLVIKVADAQAEEFILDFSKQKEGSRLNASWTARTGHGIGFQDLAAVFGFSDLPEGIPPALDLHLTKVDFAYDFTSGFLMLLVVTAGGSKAVFLSENNPRLHKRVYAFGLDVPLVVGFDSIPLLKDSLPEGSKVGINEAGIWITSELLQQAEIAQLNAKIAAVGYPRLKAEANPARLYLTANLELGTETVPFSLPLGGSNNAPVLQNAPLAPQARHMAAATGGNEVVQQGKWFNVQKTFGPLSIAKIGILYQNSKLWVLLNSSLTAGGLTIGVNGLGIGSPVNTFQPDFTIGGLDLTFNQSPVEISGGMLGTLKPLNFTGELVIALPQLSIAALGAYTELEQHPSFFLYAVLNYPLGGPACFFITGLAAGFGFNRKLLLPDLDGVPEFPFVKWAVGQGNPPGIQHGKGIGPQVDQVLTTLARGGIVTPSVGEDWLAVGIRFTTFELVDSFALLTAIFGNEFEVALLGLSRLTVPVAVDPPVARVELALKASFAAKTGLLAISGKLTSNSYILSPNCHITGGFAFYTWFSGFHEGDFVISLGGYSPHFSPPSHYPKVPRLGFNWQVTPALTLKGELYFTLTSNAIMAGGVLSAVWNSGSIKAWFIVQTDFLMAFVPFHYYLSASVDIGASFRLNLLFTTINLTVHVAASLELWGPEFSGRATVQLGVISFTIFFGAAGKSKPNTIGWPEFVGQLLPKNQEQHKALRGMAPKRDFRGGNDAEAAVVQINISGGLIKKLSDAEAELNYVVNGETLQLQTYSAIPSKEHEFSDNIHLAHESQQPHSQDGQPITPNRDFGVGPTGTVSSDFRSTHRVTITSGNYGSFKAVYSFRNVPKALWEQKEFDSHGVPRNVDPLTQTTVNNVIGGYSIVPNAPEPEHTLPIAVEYLAYTIDQNTQSFSWSQPYYAERDGFSQQTVEKTIASPKAMNNRRLLLAAIRENDFPVAAATNLDVLGDEANSYLLAQPAMEVLGEQKKKTG